MKNILLIAALLTAVGCGSGTTVREQAQQSSEPVELKVVANVGDTYVYSVSSRIESREEKEPGFFEFTASLSEKLSKNEAGILEWETVMTDIEGSSSGVMKGAEASIKVAENMVMTSVQTDRGRVKSMRVNGMDIPSQGSSNVVLPEKAVKIGDSWTADMEVSGQVFQILYTLDSIEDHDGLKAAKIVGTYPDDSMATSVEPTVFWVEFDTGKLISGSAVTDMTVEGKKLRVKYTLSRSKKEAA